MKRTAFWCVVALLSVAATGCGPTAEDLRIADAWLETDCVGPDGDTITARLRRTGTRLETYFITAFDSGPSPSLRARTDSAGRGLHGVVSAAIDIGDTLRFPGGASFVAMNDSVFAAEYIASYIIGFRSRALAALGVIASQNARAKITAVAADTSSLYRTQAQIIDAELAALTSYRIK